MDLLPPLSQLLTAFVIIIAAYTIRGIVGFGSGLIAIPFLLLFLPIKIAVILIVLLDYLAALTQGIHGRKYIEFKLIWPLIPFNIIGIILAVYILQKIDFSILISILSVLLFCYGLYYLFGLKPAQHASKLWAIPTGILGTLIGTLFGTGGPFYVIYLQLQGLDKTVFRATISSIFIIDGSMRVFSYFISGLVPTETIALFVVAVPLMLISLYIGQHIHTTISPRIFQRLIGSLLLISSITLFLK
ncbi:MAG: sulfite exporter TauE/SafE family protein [Gammaproteobacteria bacterium]|nr:sulfite exporter TauE/SafE family protein [Gammaproteobacteria bacterium]